MPRVEIWFFVAGAGFFRTATAKSRRPDKKTRKCPTSYKIGFRTVECDVGLKCVRTLSGACVFLLFLAYYAPPPLFRATTNLDPKEKRQTKKGGGGVGLFFLYLPLLPVFCFLKSGGIRAPCGWTYAGLACTGQPLLPCVVRVPSGAVSLPFVRWGLGRAGQPPLSNRLPPDGGRSRVCLDCK